MITFKLSRHTSRDVEVLEVYLDGSFVAGVTPSGEDGIRLITSHLKNDHGNLQMFGFEFEQGITGIPKGSKPN